MKKPYTLIIAIAFCLFLINAKAFEGIHKTSLSPKTFSLGRKSILADDTLGVKGKLYLAGGLGFNLWGTSMEMRYSNFSFGGTTYRGNMSHSATPMFNISGDYGIKKKLSLGIALGYQHVEMNFKDVLLPGDSYRDSWNRFHIAIRGDYYIIAKGKLNLYTGAKLGFNYYTLKTNHPVDSFPNYTRDLNVRPNPVSAQAHIGIRYFVNKSFGFNSEFGLGIGGPYLFALGLVVKI